ncbi:DUF6414 family protein [Pseudonocardia abyssalis]|uniref:Phage portal protein n=1 Tax=Pseudonocardia abyssalis TaxID=2792008 RepID=A0ABS6UY68_9PSEU|nr:hypothetical protein [Pseudonocardia abyssalis]MBW0114090.1 hypothetical protein [Pseudonocardia abyssalis]MBW0136649.1 hypothetical protein [Pseudonocardia abyssalis]
MRRAFRYLRNRYRLIRRWWTAQLRQHPLREFVYLDEISVFSLISSRLGPIASEITETALATVSAESSADVELDLKPIKAKGGSKRAKSTSSETQVLRKATIQSTFRELYEFQRESFRIAVVGASATAPTISSTTDLARDAGSTSFSGWVIDPRKLERGDLVEMKLSLEADPAYLVSSNIGAIADIVDDGGGLIPGSNSPQMAQIVALNRILERLMVGLVPLLCRATEYRAVTIDGRELLVHERILSQLSPGHGLLIRPFYVAGITELGLYWKDVRRILFSQVEYTALCRIENPAIRDRWTSVKLVDLMRSTIPDMAAAIENIGPQVLQVMSASQIGDPNQIDVRTRECRLRALNAYGRELLQRSAVAVTAADEQQIDAIATRTADALSTYPGRLAAYREIADYVKGRAGQDVDPADAIQIRGRVLRDAGLTLEAALLGAPSGTTPAGPESDQRILETEIVALYW